MVQKVFLGLILWHSIEKMPQQGDKANLIITNTPYWIPPKASIHSKYPYLAQLMLDTSPSIYLSQASISCIC